MQVVKELAGGISNYNRKTKINVPKCFVCMDSGVILYKEKTDFGYIAEYAAKCTCQAGHQYRSLISITEVMDIEKIAKQNFAAWYKNNKDKNGFKDVMKKLKGA
ncbi:hypothetical protein [Tepidibacillus sp. LV47]|uniref:hypothetical protein n=1 Tax=Tepidibacillus sp. LV47 TaxID=3398228 RepID=UPI003AAC643E